MRGERAKVELAEFWGQHPSSNDGSYGNCAADDYGGNKPEEPCGKAGLERAEFV